VVNAPDEHHRTVVHPLDDVHTPERARSVQRLCHQPRDDLLQLPSTDARTGLDAHYVMRDVEVRIV
jgi:hypothetical protein